MHELKIRVYVEDTDAGKVVYHGNFIKFFERVRTEWLRSKGFQFDQLSKSGIQFVIHSCQIQYLKPALLDDELVATAKVVEQGKAYWLFDQTLYKLNDKGESVLIATAQFKVVTVSANSLRPCAMPKYLYEMAD